MIEKTLPKVRTRMNIQLASLCIYQLHLVTSHFFGPISRRFLFKIESCKSPLFVGLWRKAINQRTCLSAKRKNTANTHLNLCTSQQLFLPNQLILIFLSAGNDRARECAEQNPANDTICCCGLLHENCLERCVGLLFGRWDKINAA